MSDHAASNSRVLHLTEFEDKGVSNMLLLDRQLADIELPRLAVMIGKSLRAHSNLIAGNRFGKAGKAGLGVFTWADTPAVWFIVNAPDRVAHSHVAVLLKMCHWTFRRIDRDMGKIRAAKTFQLRIEVGKIASLQSRV